MVVVVVRGCSQHILGPTDKEGDTVYMVRLKGCTLVRISGKPNVQIQTVPN